MLTLTNPIFSNITGAFNVNDIMGKAAVAGGGVGGYAAGKVGKALTVTVAQMVPGLARFLNPTMAAVLAGAGAVVFGRFTASQLEEWGLLNGEQADAARVGAWIEALNPLFNMLVRMFPEGYVKQAMLSGPNTYMVPVGAAYGTRLGDYAPGDFGDDASPNFPALAGEAPQFDGVPSEYNHEVLGENDPVWSGGY